MTAPRPACDVVVPVAAGADALRAVLMRLRGLALREGDTLTVVDNRGVGVDGTLAATRVATSYFARNSGAAGGRAPWIAFLDADVIAPPDLLDRLLNPAPADDVAVLAGAVADAPGTTPAARYAELKRAMDAGALLERGRWAFAQTANAAVRRSAFEGAGGFRPGVRSGGDADLCWRLRDAGWRLEARPEAVVTHVNRAGVGAMLAQRARHGTGAAWLEREHPGSLPPRRWPGLLRWGVARAAAGAAAAARGDRDGALVGLLDGPAVWAFELGRLVPNRPLRGGVCSRRPMR